MSFYLTELASDNFSYSDVSPLPSPPWTANTGTYAADTLQVVSNLCEITSLSSTLGVEFFTTPTLPDDQYCSATLANLGTSAGGVLFLEARATPVIYAFHGDCYFLQIYNYGSGWGAASEGYAEIDSIISGHGAELGSVSGLTLNPDDIWSLVAIGTTIYALQNGTIVFSVSDATLSSGVAALGGVINVSLTDVQISNFAVGSASTTGIVATSTFSPAAGAVHNGTLVTLLNADSALSGFAMYYTLDGSTPTPASTLYTSPIALSSLPETINVLATATGYAYSAIASASYTLNSSAPPLQSEFGTDQYGPMISSGTIMGSGQTRIS